MSRLLENLVTKAEEKGFAKVNGRKHEYGYVGDIGRKILN